MKKIIFLFSILLLASCEQPFSTEKDKEENGNVVFSFNTSESDVTRASVTIGDYFTKLNVMVFNAAGEKVLDKVHTQLNTDDNFGHLSMSLAEGTYTVVAVGHSSAVSASIKSLEMVQFTARDGEKLTDTFCYCGQVVIGSTPEHFSLTMNRVVSMIRLRITDTDIPDGFAQLKMEYSGGSANFNPSTYEGCTKSSQSETRQRSNANVYQAFTFPYMAVSCNLKLTISALTADNTIIHQRTIENVPVTRNRITTYTGHIFDDSGGEITQTGFGFTVNPDWDGEDNYSF